MYSFHEFITDLNDVYFTILTSYSSEALVEGVEVFIFARKNAFKRI